MSVYLDRFLNVPPRGCRARATADAEPLASSRRCSTASSRSNEAGALVAA